jgi:uncharacterized protein (TIGR03067 family)
MNRWICSSPALVALLALTASAANNPELGKLQGAWNMQTLEENGKPAPPEETKSLQLVLKNDHWTMLEGGKKIAAGTFGINPAAKAIDRMDLEGKDAGKKFHGIYEIDGDMLKTCWSPVGQERPKAFETHKGDGREFDILKRNKTETTAAHHEHDSNVAQRARNAG